MNSKMMMTVKVDQRLAMNQQLRQAITLLQYNTLELKQLVKQQLELNPLIEAEEEEYPKEQEEVDDFSEEGAFSAVLPKRNTYGGPEFAFENYSKKESLREHLLAQTLLCRFTESQQLIAEIIIDTIDENGYLTLGIDEIKALLPSSVSADAPLIESIITKMQEFDPVGVCCRNLRECLLIQLDAYPEKNFIWEIAFEIVSNYLDKLSTQNMKSVINKLKISQEIYQDAIQLIRSLTPHPGAQYSADMHEHIEPELYVKKSGSTWQVYLSESILTQVKINKEYQELIKKSKGDAGFQSIKREFEEAKWLMNGLKKRNDTLLRVGTHIIKMQTDFLDHGYEYMKPLNHADVANALNLHESTVSRITTGKYIATPRGVFELKYFFPSHVTMQTGEACSAIAVKAFIKEVISREEIGRVLSDGEIAELLQKKGINIARRTVAKYRESMNFASSYQRQIQQNLLPKTDPKTA